MTASVHVRAPSRLHFGMFGFGRSDRPQFGGVGVMVDTPFVEVSITGAERFCAHGSLVERTEKFVELAASHWRLPSLPECRIEVSAPADHTGLGVGTQLGLSVAAGLRRWLQLPELSIEALATSVGRGKRSAVGSYGFLQGGLIVDAGKKSDEPLGKLARRLALPAAWRFVLVRPITARGRAGKCEADAFARLPPVPDEITRELWRITHEQMLPDLERVDCTSFGEAVYQFGRQAGECFAAAQGGPFASPQIANLIGIIREFGVPGAGQSSWGPTVFAVAASELEATRLVEWLQGQITDDEWQITIAKPNNSGVMFEA